MVVASLLLAKTAEEGPPPLIDIDWTLFVQFGLFLLMLIVLSRWLFAPYLKLRDARSAGISGAREQAEEMNRRSDGLFTDYQTRLQRARLRGGEERARLRSEAAAHERQAVGAARDAAQRALTEARAEVNRQIKAARVKLAAEANELAAEVARKILGRELT